MSIRVTNTFQQRHRVTRGQFKVDPNNHLQQKNLYQAQEHMNRGEEDIAMAQMSFMEAVDNQGPVVITDADMPAPEQTIVKKKRKSITIPSHHVETYLKDGWHIIGPAP